MFEYIKGTLVETSPHKAVVDVGGLGYSLLIPISTFAKLPQLGDNVFFYISTVIREDSHRNFAFLKREERDLFERLSHVSGVGPKTALALIGHLDSHDFETAITTANTAMIAKVPGIGKKTAERLIVELRDKMSAEHKKISPKVDSKNMSIQDRLLSDATNALMQLGYNALQAQKAIKTALEKHEEPPELSTLITTALRG